MHGIRKFAIPVAALAIAAGCSDSTASGRVPLALSVSTKPMTASAVAAINPDLLVTSATDTLDLTSATIVLSKVELKGTSTSTCTTKETEDCSELELSPMLVTVPLGAISQLDLGSVVPAGTYHELSFNVDAVQSGDTAGAAFLTAHPDYANVSLRVQGTYKGQSFVYNSNQDIEFEMEFATPVVIGGSSSPNLTIALDAGSWFKDASGNVLNPSDPANASTIDNNIKNSFHAFEDDNHDGVPDK